MSPDTSKRNRSIVIAIGVALLLASLPLMLATGGEEHERGFDDGEEFGDGDRFEEAGEEGEVPPWEREGGDGFPLSRILNRLSGELGFVVLTLAAVGGVMRRPGSPAPIRRIASSAHYYVALAAVALVLIHSVTGLPEALEHLLELERSLGMLVGIGATGLIVLAALAHLVPRWFDGNWPAMTVHGFVYVAFAATAIHSAAVGHDTGKFVGGVALVLMGLLITRMNVARAGRVEE